MKTRIVIGIAIAAVILVGVAFTVGRPPAPVELVPTWQLLAKGAYRAMGVNDPFVSWAPDSRSLLFSVYATKAQEDKLFQWKVGEKNVRMIVRGISPSFVNEDEFLYMRGDPKAIYRRSLSAGKEQEVGAALKQLSVWKMVTGLTYNPEKRSVVPRLTEFTQFTTPGPDEYDLSGKRLGAVHTRVCDGVVDYSRSPDGSRCAILVREEERGPVSLQLAVGDECRGKEIARGMLVGQPAWSPDGKWIAYGDGKIVVLLDSQGRKQAVVGVFGDPDNRADRRCVARLIWSPNSQYLAAFVYVPDQNGDYPLYYVLDMSKRK